MSDNTNEEQKNEANEQYWSHVDLFISQANQLSPEQGLDHTSSTLLYAAARFNAFNASSKYKNADALAQDKDEAVKYFTASFEKMLRQNLDDYEKNFKQYIQTNRDKSK